MPSDTFWLLGGKPPRTMLARPPGSAGCGGVSGCVPQRPAAALRWRSRPPPLAAVASPFAKTLAGVASARQGLCGLRGKWLRRRKCTRRSPYAKPQLALACPALPASAQKLRVYANIWRTPCRHYRVITLSRAKQAANAALDNSHPATSQRLYQQ